MKKIIIILLLLPIMGFAKTSIKYDDGKWMVIAFEDEFTDKISCGVGTKNAKKRNFPGMLLFAKHRVSKPHGLLFANGRIKGIGITYRIDKNKAVTFGKKYHFETDKNSYFLRGSEFNKVVADFKKGKSVVYEVHSGNQFVASSRETLPLTGFTKAFNLAEKCDF